MASEAEIKRSHALFKGEDQVLEFTVLDSSDVAVDITGWAMTWTFATAAGVSSFTKTVGSGITITDAASGVLQVQIDAADTASLAKGPYHHSLERSDSGAVAVLSYGAAQLLDKLSS